MQQASRRPVVLLSLIGSALAFGCGGHPASPSAVAVSGPPTGTTTPPGISSIRLVSGWDNGLVDEAQVTVGGQTYHPDYDGVVRFGTSLSGDTVALDITAPGFLPRQTFLRGTPPLVTLWPADPTDVDAIKAMAYTASGEIVSKLYDSDYLGTDDYAIGGDFARSPEGAALLDNLRSSGEHLGLVLTPGGPDRTLFRLVPGPSLSGVDMALDLVDGNQCSDAWGFCASSTSHPFVVHVSRAAARSAGCRAASAGATLPPGQSVAGTHESGAPGVGSVVAGGADPANDVPEELRQPVAGQ